MFLVSNHIRFILTEMTSLQRRMKYTTYSRLTIVSRDQCSSNNIKRKSRIGTHKILLRSNKCDGG